MANETKILDVEGMTCSHCENAVKKSVGALPGVSSVAVNLQDKKVAVEFDPDKVTVEVIKQTIEDQGYDVV